MQDRNENSQVTLLEWIEPEIRQLDVRETAYNKGTGADGDTIYADCTLS